MSQWGEPLSSMGVLSDGASRDFLPTNSTWRLPGYNIILLTGMLEEEDLIIVTNGKKEFNKL
jgi:hypothetical protein